MYVLFHWYSRQSMTYIPSISKPTEPKGKVVYVYYTKEYRIRLYDNVTTTTLRLARGNLSEVTMRHTLRVFNPFAPSNRHSSLSASYRHHENLKKRHYEQRIREVEHSSFTPLVFATTGGLGPAATAFYKRLASMHALGQMEGTIQHHHWLAI